MPSVYIVKETKVPSSFRVQQVRGMFDLDNEVIRNEWNSEIPIEERQWGIGLIVGPSGSGKTTLAKEAFPQMRFHEGFEWPSEQSVLDGFGSQLETKEIVSMLNAVGFSSPPSWLKPFRVLSNGQKFRAELARCALENKSGVIFDEFTSVVDRDVARIGCAALEKALRRKEAPPFIAVSCHYDIIDWLQPDWVFNVGSQRFDWRLRSRRPEIRLDVFRTTASAWRVFREHHYLDHALSSAAACYVATWDGKPVAFTSVIHFPHPKCSNFKREHRTVVLPDFQGVGIGNILSEYVAAIYTKQGFRFISTTSAPAMLRHRANSPRWRVNRFGHASRRVGPKALFNAARNSGKRITAGFEFIG
jgi:ABC-type ATPase involved in cell division